MPTPKRLDQGRNGIRVKYFSVSTQAWLRRVSPNLLGKTFWTPSYVAHVKITVPLLDPPKQSFAADPSCRIAYRVPDSEGQTPQHEALLYRGTGS